MALHFTASESTFEKAEWARSTRLSRSDKLYDRPFREQHETAADNASAFISSAITENGGSLTRSDQSATRRCDSENFGRAPQTDADASVDLQQTPRRPPTEFEFWKTGLSALGTHARRSRWKVFTALRPFQDRIQRRAERLAPIGQAVVHLRRHLVIDRARHNAVLFEAA
jgi:hypothetical protein